MSGDEGFPLYLFHGTRAAVGKGGLLVPRADHGGTGTAAPVHGAPPADQGEWCYASTDPILAWHYAWMAPGRGKPKVLVVDPFDDVVHADTEHHWSAGAWKFKAAVVRDVLRWSPISEEQGRSGWTPPPWDDGLLLHGDGGAA